MGTINKTKLDRWIEREPDYEPNDHLHREAADTMQALLDENEHKERLLGQVWNIARDNHLEYRARIESIMAAIREKPVAKLQEQDDD